MLKIKTNLEQVTTVLFFGELYTDNSLKVASKIQEDISVFDGEPYVLPVKDAPPEIPRIIMQNKNETIKLEISFQRATLIITGDDENKFETANSILDTLSDLIYNEFNWKLKRLGRYATEKVEFADSAIKYLKYNYLKEEKFEDTEQFNLHWLQKETFIEEKANFWTKINTPEGIERKEFRITVDLNLVEDEDRELSLESCGEFFLKSVQKIEEQFRKVLV
ncbi:hypothetical protein [Halanaerobium salsuginis]|uniref:TIGR04255 family protein n=1 Tax=Halanaerobium salsuginis TaxID=29563 RepID=A0A1I4HIT8_9FIRM|nr:hypothetical protein [Halanaerobium salsuginis]SFL42149.1 hypothetical protein SAMN02983006_01112 [Halanaerobium salsuginis]